MAAYESELRKILIDFIKIEQILVKARFQKQ